MREGRFLLLLGSKGVKAHLGMNVGTRRFGRRGWHAQVDFLGRWCGQFVFGEDSEAVQTVRKGLGFCVAMIFGSAAFDEEQDGHDADGGRSGYGGNGDLDLRFHGKPSTFVFHNFGDVNAVVMGFWTFQSLQCPLHQFRTPGRWCLSRCSAWAEIQGEA